MTMMKKMAMSTIAAGALFGASLNAGTLSYIDNTGATVGPLTIAEELFEQPTTLDVLGATAATGVVTYRYAAEELEYTATIDGSGSVSDAVVNLEFNNANFTVPAGTQLVIVDTAAGNQVIAVQNNISATANGTKVSFDSDSQYAFVNGKTYKILVDNTGVTLGGTLAASNTNLQFSGSSTDFDQLQAELTLWSASGTEQQRDVANVDFFGVSPQYKVSCDTKLNNLINVENAATAFVSTKHGTLNTTDGSAGDVMDVLTDVLRVKVEKFAVDIGLTGDDSMLQIIPSDPAVAALTGLTVTSDFADNTFSVTGVAGTAPDGITPTIDVVSASPDAPAGSLYGLDANTNTYTVKFAYDGTTTIPETTFKANFYINEDDATNFWDYTPAKDYTADQAIGQWENFAYKAQIAGATQDDFTKTKLFITNRSCKAVTPQLTFIMDSKTVTVSAPEVPVNAQSKVLLSDIISANSAAFAAAGIPETGRYAVEITIPGNAEDFYVYAQAQSKTDVAATKDLPVYSTSTRTN